MDEKMMLSEFIYALRREKGYSQSELGAMVGVSNKAVSKWETLEANPELSLIPTLAAALGVTADELLSGKRMPRQSSELPAARFFGIKGEETREKGRYEFVSERKTAKGTPYLHIHIGKGKDGKLCRARGIVAMGSNATGIISMGLIAKGIVSTGFLSVGILSFGVLAVGLIALGLLNIGILIAVGLVAVGIGVAVGGIAIGTLAVGGISIGILSVGGISIGVYAHSATTGIAIGLHTFFD